MTGDNSPVARDKMKSFVDRIVNLEEEKATFADDIKEVYAEAKAAEFDRAALRLLVRRKMEDNEKAEKRKALEEKFELYLHAMGMLD